MDFDDIAEAQGWSVSSQLMVALDFIFSNNLSDALDEHAQAVANNENKEW